jgi:hypothetical protein
LQTFPLLDPNRKGDHCGAVWEGGRPWHLELTFYTSPQIIEND